MMLNSMLKRSLSSSSAGTTSTSVRYFGFRPKQEPIRRWNIVKDDFVQVISGRYRKNQGKVLKVFRKTN